MGIARSTFYNNPAVQDDTAIVEAISGICEEFEFYGWRRVRAELRHRGLIVNHKKVRRLMREHDLQPRRRRRYVATTDSDHDQPIYPNRAKGLAIDGPDQLWVADITYVATPDNRCHSLKAARTGQIDPKHAFPSWTLYGRSAAKKCP
jgi:putative transposase